MIVRVHIFTLLRVHNLKKFDNTGEDLEDLISIGTIGLIKAIESFSPNKGTKLATFAARCIENEILMHLRSLKKTRKDVDKVQQQIEKSKISKNLDILDKWEYSGVKRWGQSVCSCVYIYATKRIRKSVRCTCGNK
jgi:RNA polymerase sporulation-specific sigma factor